MAFLGVGMRLVAILLLGSLLCCQHSRHIEKTESKETTVDSTALLATLEYLGGIAYDHPEQFVHNPDSFLNLLPSLPVTAAGREMYAWLLLNIGYGLRENGNLLESARYYELAMEYHSEHGLTDPDFVLYIAKPLGNLYTQIGDLQKALHIHKQAIALTKARDETSELPALYSNLAIVYQQIGWRDSLLRACATGLSFTVSGDIQAAMLYNTMARSYQEQGAVDSAGYFNGLALSLFSGRNLQGDTLIWYTSALHLYSYLAAEGQHRLEAMQGINQAIVLAETYFPDSKQREKAKYYYLRGNLHTSAHRLDDARMDFRKALELFSPDPSTPYSFPDYTFTETLWGMARSMALMRSDSAGFYYIKAVENAYYTQRLIVNSESHYQNSAWNRTLLGEAMAQLWVDYRNTPGSDARRSLAQRMLWVTELSKGRQLLQEINRSEQWRQDGGDTTVQRQQEQLQRLHQAIAEEQRPAARQRLMEKAEQLAFAFQLAENHFDQRFIPPDFGTFRTYMDSMPDSVAAISYFIAPQGDGYRMSWAGGEADAGYLPTDSLSTVPDFLDAYFGLSPLAYENAPDTYRHRAAAVASLLLSGTKFQRERLIISPDGFLLALPFDALVQRDRFLGENTTISHTYTLLQQVKEPAPEPAHTTLAVFAKHSYVGTDLPDLPSVTSEADYLVRNFRATSHIDGDATEEAMIGALADGRLVHLAAHAVAEGCGDPYMVLDQHVTLDKLRYIRAASPLVFLSACQTGAGKLLQGEGVESLNKAFLGKGVKGIVASYWPVDDGVTARLSRLFYEALAETGSPATALAAAKRKYIATVSDRERNPWYWSSLQYTGVDVPVRIQTRSRYGYWWYLFAVAVAVLLTVRYRKKLWGKNRDGYHLGNRPDPGNTISNPAP